MENLNEKFQDNYDVAQQLSAWIEAVDQTLRIENTLSLIEHFRIIFDDIQPDLVKFIPGDWSALITDSHNRWVNSGRSLPSLTYYIFDMINNGGLAMGRPSLSDEVRKDSIHSTCLDIEDSEFIKGYAEKLGISVSDAIRQAVIYLKVKVSPKV